MMPRRAAIDEFDGQALKALAMGGSNDIKPRMTVRGDYRRDNHFAACAAAPHEAVDVIADFVWAQLAHFEGEASSIRRFGLMQVHQEIRRRPANASVRQSATTPRARSPDGD